MDNLINISYQYYNNALDLMEMNNISEAKRLLEKAVKIYSGDIDILNLLGLCEYYNCDFNKANIYWTKSLNIEKKNIASEYIKKLNTSDFISILESYNIGLDYFNEENYKEAIDIFENILKVENRFIEVYEILIEIYKRLNEIENLKIWVNRLILVDSGNELLNRYKYLLTDKKVTNKNKYELKNVTNKNKKYKIKIRLVICSIIILLFILNIHSYYKVRNQNQENINIKKELKKRELEIDKLQKELKLENIATEFIFSNKDDNLMMDLQKEYEKDYFKGDYQKSKDGFEYILKYSNNNSVKAEAIYFLAASNLNLNRKEEAKKYYEMYLNDCIGDRAYDEMLYNYAILLEGDNNIEKSKEIAQKLVEDYPKSVFNNSKITSILNK